MLIAAVHRQQTNQGWQENRWAAPGAKAPPRSCSGSRPPQDAQVTGQFVGDVDEHLISVVMSDDPDRRRRPSAEEDKGPCSLGGDNR